MRRLYKNIVLLILTPLLCGACTKIELERVAIVRTDSVFNITTHGATIRSTILDRGDKIISYGHLWDSVDNVNLGSFILPNKDDISVNTFDSELTGLSPGKQYFARSFIQTEGGYILGEVRNLITLAYSIPIIETGQLIEEGALELTINGEISDLGPGNDTVLFYGHCYSEDDLPTLKDSVVFFTSATSPMKFTSKLNVLSGKTYAIRAFAINEFDTVYGEVILGHSLDISPTVSIIIDSTNISPTWAGYTFYCSNYKGAVISQFGVCWDTLPNPNINNSCETQPIYSYMTQKNFSFGGGFSASPDALYFLRGFVISNIGIRYSSEVQVKLPAE